MPTANAVVLKVATEEPLAVEIVPVPSVLEPSVKVTVPVGSGVTPVGPAMVAVKVTWLP